MLSQHVTLTRVNVYARLRHSGQRRARVQRRMSAQPHTAAIVYTMMSDWRQVKDNVAALPAKVRYWIAGPTGAPHVVPRRQRHAVVLGQQLRHHNREPGLRSLAEAGS